MTKTVPKKKKPGWRKGQHRSLQEKDIVRQRWLKELLDNPNSENRLNLKMTDREMAALYALAENEGVSPGIVLRRLIMKQSFETFGETAR